jgi:hypothetical protein
MRQNVEDSDVSAIQLFAVEDHSAHDVYLIRSVQYTMSRETY